MLIDSSVAREMLKNGSLMLWNECYSSFKVVNMKKYFLIPFFSLFIILLFPFYSSASYLPPVDPVTTQIPSFLETVAQTQVANNTGVYSPYKPDLNAINQIVNGRTIADSMVEVYVDNDVSATYTTFYDSNGNVVPQADTYTAFGTCDIGSYTYVADKNTGEILGVAGRNNRTISSLMCGNSTADFPTTVLNSIILAGGNTNYDVIYDAYEDAKLRESLAVYSADDLSTTDKEFIDNNDFHLYMHSNYYGWTVYVPNACSNECIVSSVDGMYSYSGNYYSAPSIYANSLSSVTFVNGNDDNRGFLKPYGPWNYFGYNFTYTSAWTNSSNPMFNGGYLDIKAPTQAQYNTYKSLSNKYRIVRPVTVQGDTNQNYYYYTYVTENPPQYITNVNNNYDPTLPQSLNNYPLVTNLTLPSYQNENNYITEIFNYYTTPNNGGGNVGSITDPVLPENIPLLSNLEYRFPFSIPFDLYKLAKGLSVPRETPYIDTVIIIPGINYSWHLEYDLHQFDNVAELFRLLELILFIVALAIFSYDHFFGS